jgi:hypothetical protein
LRRGKDIPLLAVGIVKQGNPSRSIWIVFDGGDLRRDLPFVPFEVNQSIFSFMPSSSVPGGNPSVTVSPPCLFQRAKETSFRRHGGDFLKLGDGLKPLSRRGGSKLLNRHFSTPSNPKFEILISKQIQMTKIQSKEPTFENLIFRF